MRGSPFSLQKSICSFAARCPEIHHLCRKVRLDRIALLTFLPIKDLSFLYSCPAKLLEMFSGFAFSVSTSLASLLFMDSVEGTCLFFYVMLT